MSSDSDYFDFGPDAAYYVWITSFHDLSSAVVLYYDYVLTLPREIQFLWPPHNKQGWFTLAYFLNRYIPIIGVFPLVLSHFIRATPQLCKGLHIYHEWLMVTVQTHAGILCLLRVYALYGQSRRILGLLLFLGMGAFVTALVLLFVERNAGGKIIPFVSTFAGCAQYMPYKRGQFAAISWIGALVFDSAIFSLTLYKAFKIGRGINLLYVIVRDGTMYFSALSLMNLVNIMTLLMAPNLLKTSGTSYTSVLSTVLVNRLVLNLRERAVRQLPITVETTGRFQAALPVPRQLPSMTSSFVPQNILTATATHETVASVPAGEFPSQERLGKEVWWAGRQVLYAGDVEVDLSD